MPELPEVEIMSRNLHRWMAGHTIKDVEVLDPKLNVESLRSVEGQKVIRAYRRAKYAIIELADGQSLVLHYRMTGKTVLDPQRRRKARLRWVMDTGQVVSFEDPRRFGTCECIASADGSVFFDERKVGPEPWPTRRDAAWWQTQLAGLRGPIKPALMRQDRVAGLGNIAASEILYRAKIHPTVPVPMVQDRGWIDLAQAVPAFIEHTLQEESGDEIAYVNMGGAGSFQVYGHAGEACSACGTLIERMVQSGRSTYFCAGCQSV